MRQSFGGKRVERRLAFALAAAAASVTFRVSPSFAPEAKDPPRDPVHEAREACLANHEQAQLRRIEKRLIAARSAARACAVTECPAAIRSDCSDWVGELSKLIPTILLVAESGSGELENVRVTLDGVVLTEKLDGTAMEVEPGPHILRFEHGTEPPIDRRVNVPEGEKSFMVRVRFAGDARPVAPVAPIQPAPQPSPARPRDAGTRPIPLTTYVFGGVAVAAAATSAVVAASAFSEKSKASDECAPNCDEARIDEIHDRFLLADVAGGVAIASAGLAVFFYFTRPTVPSETSGAAFSPFVGVNPRRSGVELRAGGTF